MADAKPGPAGQADHRGAVAGGRGATRAETIVFQCPNGHRISVPVKLAGKRGACSKCGTAVVIPAASVDAASAAGKTPPLPAGGGVAGDEPVPADEGTITLSSPPPWVPPAAPLVVAPPAVEVAGQVGPAPSAGGAPRHDPEGTEAPLAVDSQPGMLPLVNTGENATAVLEIGRAHV